MIDLDAPHVARETPAAPPDADCGSFVYFVQPEDWPAPAPIKVGTSAAPAARVAQLQTQCPTPLALLCCLPGNTAHERYILDRFSTLRLHGEWLSPSLPLLAFVAEAAAAGELPGYREVAWRFGTLTDPSRRSRLGNLMKFHGITTRELAAAVGVGAGAVGSWRSFQFVPQRYQDRVVRFFNGRGIALDVTDLFEVQPA